VSGPANWNGRIELAALVTAPKFEHPWRSAPLSPYSLSDLVRVREALRNLDRTRPASDVSAMPEGEPVSRWLTLALAARGAA
jgi:hypothetical protein